MNIRQLKIFKTVCEHMSITKASRQLYMTQPAVSRAISELEQELDLVLFDRISRRIYLTEAGKLFYTKTITTLDMYEDLENCSCEILQKAPLRIGSSITLANYLLPSIIQKFQSIYKTTNIKVIVDNAKNIENLLFKNEIDIALVEGFFSNENEIFEKKLLPPYDLAIICSKSHPFSNKDNVSIDELKFEKLLLREKGSAIRDTFDSALLLHNIIIEPIWVSSNSQALLKAASNGLGIAVLPTFLVRDSLLENSISYINISELSLICPNQLLYYKHKHKSDIFKKFISTVLNEAELLS